MSGDELQDFAKRVSSLLELAKLCFGMVIAVIVAVFSLALWVNNKASAIDLNTAELSKLQVEAKQLVEWRSKKDEIDIRFAIILESQGHIIQRLQDVQDKLASYPSIRSAASIP